MQEKPLISIITITFNAGELLKPTVESVMNQTFNDFEHIVIDGASTDNTLEIARLNPKVRILSEPDKGLYDAMNKGLKMARGKYLLFLNAGDSFRSDDTLALYAREALKDRDIIYGDTMIVDKDRQDLRPRHHSAPDLLTFKSFSKGMLICHQAFMVKKELAPEYDLNYRLSADYDWTVKCIAKSSAENCTNLKTVTINYLSDGMTDKNKIKSLKERYRIMSYHYGSIPTLLHHLKLILRLRF